MKTEAERTDKFIRGLKSEIQGFVQVFKPTTQADALHMAVDLSLHERSELAKAVKKGPTSGQKWKTE